MSDAEHAAHLGVPRTILPIAAIALTGGLAAAAGVVSTGARVESRSADEAAVAAVGALAGGLLGIVLAIALRHLEPIRRLGPAATTAIVAAIGALLAIGATNEWAATDTTSVPTIDEPAAEGADADPTGPGAAPESADETGDGWALGDLEGSLVLAAGLIGLVAAAAVFARRSEMRPVERSAVYLASGLLLADEEEHDDPDPEEIGRALARALDAMLAEREPRLAIRAAYGRLLAELELLGLGRRAYEGPTEHLRRCLNAGGVPARPVGELVGLFEIARFSDHPVVQDDADRARRALADCLDARAPR